MAPRTAKSSSKALAAATRVNSAKQEKASSAAANKKGQVLLLKGPSSAAANKKRKAEAVPPAAATTYAYTYVLLKCYNDGKGEVVSTEGAYPSRRQAYAAAVGKFISQLEDVEDPN